MVSRATPTEGGHKNHYFSNHVADVKHSGIGIEKHLITMYIHESKTLNLDLDVYAYHLNPSFRVHN